MTHNTTEEEDFIQWKRHQNNFNRRFCISFLTPNVIAIFINVLLIMIFIKVYNLDAKYESLGIVVEGFSNNTKRERGAELMEKLIGENSTDLEKNPIFLKIINRVEWGAADPAGPLKRFNKSIDLVIICHTDTQNCSGFDSCKLQLNMIQLFFIQLRNFEDIGYNFLIGGDGAVYEGVGWNKVGYHTKGHNENSIGIGFIGNYQSNSPTETQLSTATLLLSDGLQKNYLSKNYVLKGQRDLLPIISPGINIYNRIKRWGRFKLN